MLSTLQQQDGEQYDLCKQFMIYVKQHIVIYTSVIQSEKTSHTDFSPATYFSKTHTI